MRSDTFLRNEDFEVAINPDHGTVLSMVNTKDPHRMNWVEGKREWGDITVFDAELCRFKVEHLKTSIRKNRALSTFNTDNLHITVERQFTEYGMFCELYRFTNRTEYPLTLSESDLGIVTPFNDNYQDFATCSTNRCHAHIWCGGSVAYVEALRMGGDPPHLGLVLSSGKISEYSIIRETVSNDRGDIILHPSMFSLNPGESHELSWLLFWHTGEADFYRQAKTIPGFIQVEAENFTCFPGEEIVIRARSGKAFTDLEVSVNEQPLKYTPTEDGVYLREGAKIPGERRYVLKQGKESTFCNLLVVPDLEAIVKGRCDFIAGKQQFLEEDNPLHGAYLIYDKERQGLCYGHHFRDHGAGREKIGMGVLIALLLSSKKKLHNHEELAKSLDLYYEFLQRELYDEKTGIVFNRIGRSNHGWHRLYNYPWVATLQMELFKVKQDPAFLRQMVKTVQAYYEHGGDHFYSLCLPMLESVQLLESHGYVEESKLLASLYLRHADTIVENGLAYPAHEVDYEQSIVAPAASYTLQAYLLTGKEPYLEAAKKHIAVLELFSGNQPDYHLNRISIRHWDGYWFGKRKLYGDTFPHYWSVLSAEAFYYYHQVSGLEKYRRMTDTILRNNLCLFDGTGFGSCAYLYPYSVNDTLGKFHDPWANDQDWALVYAMKFMNNPSFA